MHYVYLLECVDGTLYTGYTVDLEQRLAKHQSGKGAKYTRSRRPVQLRKAFPFDTKGEALRFEYRVKQLSRQEKLRLLDE